MSRRMLFAGGLLALTVSLALGADVASPAQDRSTVQVKQVPPSSVPPPGQAADTVSPARGTVRGHARPTLDDRVKTLSKSLDLNETQQSAVKKILEQRQQETLRLKLDSSISGSTRIDRFRALQDETVARIRSVLNEEQKKKYEPFAPRRLPPAPDQRSVEDWIQITTKN